MNDGSRFLTHARRREVRISDGTLLVDGTPLVRKRSNRFIPLAASDLRLVIVGDGFEQLASQARKIARLMNEGRNFEAVHIASFSLPQLATGDERISKLGFNPFEPRDRRGLWTNGAGEAQSASIEDVQYRGYFHDFSSTTSSESSHNAAQRF